MTGKAKPKKHTAKEIAAKIDAATTNRGGGKAGMADRTGIEKGGHAKYECPHCKTTAPDLKSMQIHHEARHPKLPYEEDKLINRHAALAVETSKGRPGIRGSLKKCFGRPLNLKLQILCDYFSGESYNVGNITGSKKQQNPARKSLVY
ncbi:hypothetical protein F8388_019668 [Cannabis sativa]|uniref:Uncharacterized protein n=3 Tax=Cannabis sativa TaxID=3483 RepID=A0A7J6E2G8_CANSA|nr:hypothetical protein F8388_019668 [Cannabis sativa]KAF4370251.1 hypothetical protein G4B88_021725 [Cannabis sativa]